MGHSCLKRVYRHSFIRNPLTTKHFNTVFCRVSQTGEPRKGPDGTGYRCLSERPRPRFRTRPPQTLPRAQMTSPVGVGLLHSFPGAIQWHGRIAACKNGMYAPSGQPPRRRIAFCIACRMANSRTSCRNDPTKVGGIGCCGRRVPLPHGTRVAMRTSMLATTHSTTPRRLVRQVRKVSS